MRFSAKLGVIRPLTESFLRPRKFLYKCELCGVQSVTGVRQHRLVVEKTRYFHPRREHALRVPRGRRRDDWKTDPGGTGTQIKREARVCPTCSVGFAGCLIATSLFAPSAAPIKRDLPDDGLVEAPQLRAAVLAALSLVGLGPVDVSLDNVYVDDQDRPLVVRAVITLNYRKDAPVCCSEPGCYVPFLGRHRRDVRSALAVALSRSVPPRFSLFMQAQFEPGFVFTEPTFVAENWTVLYDEAEFADAE